jgi:predicted aldo/keto reductase-like oxidoreductase
MLYRKLGSTDMEASVIGLGAEHLDFKPYAIVEETIHAALEHGVNIIDCFMPGDEVRRNIGKALGGNRSKVIIQGHIGATDIRQQYDISRDLPTCKRYFENLMTFLDTDYIDVGMLYFIDSEKDYNAVFETEIIDYAIKLKEQGVIRTLGASSHIPETAMRVVETGLIDVLMFSTNPIFDMAPPKMDVLDFFEHDVSFSSVASFGMDPQREKLYSLCVEKNVSITVMKAFGGGKLLSPDHSPFSVPLTPVECIHYALGRPGVASVLVGSATRAEMLQSLGYLGATEQERDYSAKIKSATQDFRGKCVYCSHCQPCPADINIATVMKYLDIAKLDTGNIPPSIVRHYSSLDAKGSDCIACGSCEERCPFSVPIIDSMAEAKAVFV